MIMHISISLRVLKMQIKKKLYLLYIFCSAKHLCFEIYRTKKNLKKEEEIPSTLVSNIELNRGRSAAKSVFVVPEYICAHITEFYFV